VLLAADDADRPEPEDAPGGRRRADVVGVGAAERQQGVVPLLGGGLEVVLELAPLVPRELRVDQVVPLEEEPGMWRSIPPSLAAAPFPDPGFRGIKIVAGEAPERTWCHEHG
jgi:hypothetical protein